MSPVRGFPTLQSLSWACLDLCIPWSIPCALRDGRRGGRRFAPGWSRSGEHADGCVVQGADLQAATAAVSTPVDMVRAQLADRGVNSSTHGHVANDADIAEELKALWAGTSAAWSAG
jgi:hypothetical protein